MSRTAFLSVLLAILALFTARAKPVSLSFVPMYTDERKTLELDWDTSWFSQSPSKYNHGLARISCFLADVSYSVDADGDPADLIETYRKLGADPDSIATHYNLDYNSSLGNDQCAFSIATVPLPDGSSLVILVIRGTPAGNNEWLSNLNIANSKKEDGKKAGSQNEEGWNKGMEGSLYHEGFLKAEQIILKSLVAYAHGWGMPGRKTKLLITGHSRGAAVANIIGSHIVQQNLFDTSGCYIYTVASPNVTTLDEKLAKGEMFSFIWNIVNAEDVVPSIPFNKAGNWNYRKFGNIKVLANAWSVGRKNFYESLCPKMNNTYRYLTGKDYQPSGTGPFIQVQLGRMLASMNPDVDSFYKGAFSLHGPLAKIVPAMFPSEEEKAEAADKKPSLTDRILGKVDKGSDGAVSKIFEIVNNLHQSESYLSFLMGLDEKECFSDSPSVQLVIKGLPEAAVLDDKGNEITHVKEGQTKLFELHESMSACVLGLKELSLGFPTDEDFDVLLTDNSVFPTPVSLTIERYSADGVLLGKEEEQVYPCQTSAYRIKAGKPLLSIWGLDPQTLTGKAQREARSITGAWKGLKKRLSFEMDLDSDLNLGLGASYGTQLIYGLILYRIPFQENFLGTWEIDTGLGHKTKLWNSTYLNSELLLRGVFVPDSDLRDESEEETGKSGIFSLVPALRLSLAWQPLRKAQLYTSATGSLFIKNFNDAAFESHRVTIDPAEMNNDLALVVSLGVGLRF